LQSKIYIKDPDKHRLIYKIWRRERDSPPENSSPRNSWLTVTVKLEWQSLVAE
jgi:hypothetical protein